MVLPEITQVQTWSRGLPVHKPGESEDRVEEGRMGEGGRKGSMFTCRNSGHCFVKGCFPHPCVLQIAIKVSVWRNYSPDFN